MSQIIMTDVRAALVGACGKMGTGIVRKIMSVEGITVAAAFDLVRIGEDIGEVAGIGKIGVPASGGMRLYTRIRRMSVYTSWKWKAILRLSTEENIPVFP